ncbi:hypothetical protein [Streptomyces roseochromogenus]|uniref:Uncharacterized protein n=1 Tax=Streptomyces roseochromogenus subsp. oscitans DS 12.976 TaxID=1352936 RepID=V6KNS5_STRRC|nr:hypothetical protein [Streptomyces roseochromogenus]EST33742.1 hypothetical protein M878_11895 [Streptomyces roseochromogenus subsp. oscitans DS 12.976]
MVLRFFAEGEADDAPGAGACAGTERGFLFPAAVVSDDVSFSHKPPPASATSATTTVEAIQTGARLPLAGRSAMVGAGWVTGP